MPRRRLLHHLSEEEEIELIKNMNMVVVCCMCGDVGFADKLFRCSRCTNRFQHSYCSNYYISTQSSSTQIDICDWCRYEESNASSSTSKHQATNHAVSKRTSNRQLLQMNNRSEYSSGDRVKQNEQREGNKGKQGGAPSPRTATKRYKLLKDVMC